MNQVAHSQSFWLVLSRVLSLLMGVAEFNSYDAGLARRRIMPTASAPKAFGPRTALGGS